MNNTCDLSFEETSGYGAASFPEQCANCQSTGELFDFWPADQARPVRMCEDCCEEQARLEAKAAALVAVESCCPARAQIVANWTRTSALVLFLVHHDAVCPLCRPVPKLGPAQASLFPISNAEVA